MTLSSHVEQLRKRHRELGEQVEKAQRSPSFDEIQLARMKKEKLRLKEEIERHGG